MSKHLNNLLKEVDKLFPSFSEPKLCTYNYTLGKFPYGWVFTVTNNWYAWSERDLEHNFGAYKEPEYAIQAFLDYVAAHKIDVMELCEK